MYKINRFNWKIYAIFNESKCDLCQSKPNKCTKIKLRMILDSLNNTEKAECLHPLLKKAFDYLKATDFSKMEDGKYELDGAKLYLSVTSLFGKEKENAAIETHKKYIDIHMPLLGVEKIGWKPGSELQEESVPYNEEQDIAFYVDRPTAYTKIYPGQFIIYFPEDGHAPGIGKGAIRKVVVKILAES